MTVIQGSCVIPDPWDRAFAAIVFEASERAQAGDDERGDELTEIAEDFQPYAIALPQLISACRLALQQIDNPDLPFELGPTVTADLRGAVESLPQA